jgi:hypothetical protein
MIFPPWLNVFAILLRYLDTRFWTDRFAQVTGHTIFAVHRLRFPLHQLKHSVGTIVDAGAAANTKLRVHFDQDHNLASLFLRHCSFPFPYFPVFSNIVVL